MNLTELIIAKANELGATEVGICKTADLPRNAVSLNNMLPGCRSVVCILFAHAKTALDSSDIQLKQYETVFCYNEIARISQYLVRYLEREGYQAVAVPAYIPINMADEKMGMVGAIDWKQAAVESGLASWGKSGLVVNPHSGPRMRLGGLITTAELEPSARLDFSPCENCQKCIKTCPVGALQGDGQIDKKLCGDQSMAFGMRAFTRLLREVATAESEKEIKEAIYSRRTRELWQTFETGNYYYCWECQSSCPVGQTERHTRKT